MRNKISLISYSISVVNIEVSQRSNVDFRLAHTRHTRHAHAHCALIYSRHFFGVRARVRLRIRAGLGVSVRIRVGFKVGSRHSHHEILNVQETQRLLMLISRKDSISTPRFSGIRNKRCNRCSYFIFT